MSQAVEMPVVSDRRRTAAAVLAALALVGLLLAWMPASFSMVRRWMGSQDYYTHGLLVPVIAAYLVWMRREALSRAPVRRGLWGLLPLTVGCFGQLVAAYANVAFASGFSMLLVLMGLVWFVFGGAVFRQVLFPLVFLGFMVPLYQELLEQIGFRMKMQAAMLSLHVLRDLIGIPCAQRGNTLLFANAQLEVGDACSGLRSLIALLALGALIAYLARLPWWRRLLLFVMSVPFALAGNVARITVLALVANRWGEEAAMGDLVHFGTGFLVFVVAVTFLLGLWRLLRIGVRTPPAAPGETRQATGLREALRRAAVVLLVVAAAKALGSMFLLEEFAKTYVTPAYVAQVQGVAPADLSTKAFAEVWEALRQERIARATLDTNYVFFTIVGLIFFVQGARWARAYLLSLAAAGLLADLGYVVWLFRWEHLAVPNAALGVQAVLVGLHLVLWSGVSAATLIWTMYRLKERGVLAALGGAASVGSEPHRAADVPPAAVGAVLMFLLAALTWWLMHPASPVDAGVLRARSVPLRIGDWTGQEFEPDPVVYETLETRDILSRVYRAPDRLGDVELSVIFSQHNRRATHPPEICLKGSGWETDHRRRVVLRVPRGANAPETPFVELVSKDARGRVLLTFYVFKAGRLYTNNYFTQQWEILLMNVRGEPARGALVRFSTEAPAAGRDAARNTLLQFMHTSMPLIETALEGRSAQALP
jgi:EpsI family protein